MAVGILQPAFYDIVLPCMPQTPFQRLLEHIHIHGQLRVKILGRNSKKVLDVPVVTNDVTYKQGVASLTADSVRLDPLDPFLQVSHGRVEYTTHDGVVLAFFPDYSWSHVVPTVTNNWVLSFPDGIFTFINGVEWSC